MRDTSLNAPDNRDVFSTATLSIASGRKRYAHIAALRGDGALPKLSCMKKFVSEAEGAGPGRLLRNRLETRALATKR